MVTTEWIEKVHLQLLRKNFRVVKLNCQTAKRITIEVKRVEFSKLLLKLFKAIKTFWFIENKLYLHSVSNLRKLELSLTETGIKLIDSN